MGASKSIFQLIFDEIKCRLMRETVPKFFGYFDQEADGSRDSRFQLFRLAVDELHGHFLVYTKIASRCSMLLDSPGHGEEMLGKYFKSALLSQLPLNFSSLVDDYLDHAFRVFAGTMAASEQDSEMDGELGKEEFSCQICESESTGCRCSAILKAFQETNRKLLELDIMNRLCGPTVAELVEEKIESLTAEMCQGMLRSNSRLLENWLERVVFGWLRRVYQFEADGNSMGAIHVDCEAQLDTFNGYKERLEHFLCQTYARIIIDQFFNIIIEYPDSSPAIDDLRLCLKRVDMRSYLMRTIKRSLESRILHPGVETGDILTGYVAAIKALRHLDPSGVLLEAIIEPVKDYLRSRPDTVRCVITSLIEDTCSDLADELAKSEAVVKPEGSSGTTDEMLNWDKWQPDPVDAAPQKEATRTSRSADIISMVVDIYGSKELFVKEYKTLLAERLLLNLDLNTEREIRNLELLKLRFGENVLHSCEVMLKDISDSKRINAHIQADTNYVERKEFEMSTLILSSQFWPGFKKETLELPEKIMRQFEGYTKSYEAHKGNRSLLWRPTNGKVTLEVQVGDKEAMEYTVTPTQATIIIHFESQKQWTLQDLAAQMKLTPVVLKKKISFWQSHGLIRETAPDEYCLVEEADDVASTSMPVPVEDDEEADHAMESANDQREEALQVFWSYIVGMLTNLESLPLERIHQMLKMFASHSVEFSQQELRGFLQKKVQAQLLVFVSGVYQLPK